MTLLGLDPVPEARGSLREPPRRPPTANGIGRLPPAPPPHPKRSRFIDRSPRRHTMLTRLALGALSLLFTLGALRVASSNTVARVAAVTSLAASVDIGLHAMSGSRHPWREIVAPAARRTLRRVRNA